MAELGSLHVSLSLDATNFNGSIAQVNRQMRAMGGELQAIKSKGKDYENSIEGLSKRQDVLQRSLNASSLKLQETRKRYDELVASGKASDAQIERAAIAVNRAQAEYNRLEKELADVSKALKTQSSLWTQAGQKMQDIGGKFKSVGSNITSVGKDLTMKVTAPIVAMGAGILKAGIDFEASMSKVQALSGATGAEMAKLEEQAKELGTTTVFSASQAADGMAFLAMAGWETSDIIAGMPGLLDLAASGSMELGRAADITSNIMSAFTIEASNAGHVADVLAAASSNANTNVEQMGTAMTYLAPVANTLGWSLEETAAAVMAMSDAGIQGEKAGAAFSTSLQRLANPTKAMKNVMEELNITFFDAEGQIKPLPQLIGELEEATKDLTSEQEAAALSTIFGAEAYKNWAVLLESGSETLANNTKMLVEADGAAKEMADTMMDNAKGAIVEFKSAIEGISIQLSKHLLPFVTQAIDKLTEMVRGFGELSPETQKTILAIGGVVAAAGPLLLIGGSIIAGIGGLVTTFGALSTAVGSAGGAIALLSNPIGWAVGAIAGFTAGVGLLYTKWDEFKNASPLFQGAITALFAPIVGVTSAIKGIEEAMKPATDSTNAWKDSVSDATKKVVGSFIDLHDETTVILNELNWGIKAVTTETAETITSNFTEMSNQITAKIEENKNEALATMNTLMAESVSLTKEEQQQILESLEHGYNDRYERVKANEERIKEIMQVASENKRALTRVEKQQINQIQQEMLYTGINLLTENEMEQQVILERMKQQAGEITAQQAAAVVKNSVEQKNKVVAEAEEQFNKAIAEIIHLRDEAGVISAEQADLLIQEAQRQKDESVKAAEEMHSRIVEEAQKQAEEHLHYVDWETGEVKSKWEVFKSSVLDIATQIRDAISTKWNEIWTTTKEKAEDIKQAVENKFNEKVLAITNKMEEIKLNIEAKWNAAQKFLEEIDLVEIGKDIIGGLLKGITDRFPNVEAKIEELSNNIPLWAKKVLKIQSPSRVMMSIGSDIVGGLIQGIDTNKQAANKTVNELGQVIISATKSSQAEIDKININAEKERAKVREDYAFKRRTLKKKTLENIQKLEREEAQKITKINEKAQSDILKIQEKADSEKLKAIQNFVRQKKELEGLSIVHEAKIWEESLKHFQDGTNEKVQAQINYRNASKAVYDEIVSINQEYSNKILEVNENLKEREKELTETYTNAVDDRAKSLMNFAGLFDEFDVKFDVSGKKLLKNLQDQVDGFKTWQEEIEKLSQRAIDEGLLEELRQMGPEALPQLVALNKLTDDELTKYSDLYKEKSELARQQATNELEWLKRETDAKLVALNVQTRIQLTQLQGEWTSRIKAITQTTEEEFESMHDIGVNAMQGLSDGLESMEPQLMRQARRIANQIRREIERALDIRSPSRVMKGIGVYIGQGLIDGMEATVAQVANASAKLAESATSGFGGASTSTTSIDNSRHFQPTVTIHTMDSGARAMERTLRKMAFEFN